MRKIKFRFWNELTKRFETDNLNTNPYYQNPFARADLIACQFTGLSDKNGKEIYEGDILNYRSQPVVVEYFGDIFHCRSTKYPNLTPGNYRLMTLKDTCEVLGNIYQNKYLLTQPKDSQHEQVI